MLTSGSAELGGPRGPRPPHLFGIYLVKISKISFEEAQAYVEENGLIFLETSAKNAENVDEIFFEIARKLPMLEVYLSNAHIIGRIRPGEEEKQNGKRAKCCNI